MGTPRTSTDLSRFSLDGKARTSKDNFASRSKHRSWPRRFSASNSQTGSMDVFRQQRSLPQRVRLNNRIVDLRTAPAQAIFRIQSGYPATSSARIWTAKDSLKSIPPSFKAEHLNQEPQFFEVDYFGTTVPSSPNLLNFQSKCAFAADFERV